jgi:hypothetical protein
LILIFFDLVDLVTRLKLEIQILNRAEFKNYEIKAYLLMQFRLESFINYYYFFFNKNSNCSKLHSDSEKTNEYFKKENNEQDIKD